MDWQALRDAAWKWNNNGDDAAGQLCRFIPADPNKAADAEWLKERGWQYFDDDTNTLYSPASMDFMFCDGFLFIGDSNRFKASRMYVALFEAAARQGEGK